MSSIPGSDGGPAIGGNGPFCSAPRSRWSSRLRPPSARSGRGRGAQGGDREPENYAAVGMEQFVNGYESLIRQSFMPVMPPTDDVEPTGPHDPLPVADMLGRWHGCSAIRAGAGSLPAPARSSGSDWIPRTRRWWTVWVGRLGRARSPRSRRSSPPGRQPGAGGVAIRLSGERDGAGAQFVFFTSRADSVTGHRFAYGFSVPAARMVERVFRPAFQSLRVIPRHLLAGVFEKRRVHFARPGDARGSVSSPRHPPTPTAPPTR